MMRRLPANCRRSLVARLRTDDSGVALAMALFLIVAVGALSIAIAGVTLAQVKPTQLEAKNVRTVHAAEAGLDVGLSRLRAAKNADGTGAARLLPCTAPGTVTLNGAVTSDRGNLAYAVRIRYYLQDPSGQSETWRAANALACSGSGGPVHVPSYALLQSKGTGDDVAGVTAGSGNRTLETVYNVSTSNVNVAGGLIRVSGHLDYCVAAVAAAIDQSVTVAPCDPADSRQIWAYRRDLTLFLLSSTTVQQGGLCIAADNNANDDTVTLERCWSGNRDSTGQFAPLDSTDATARLRQQWSYNDNGKFDGPDEGGDVNGYCIGINTGNPASSTGLNERKCASANSWVPEAKVGAGQAGSQTGLPDPINGQLVNYKEFGRCFDVTNQNMNKTFMIDYPCKQAPDATKVRWNQRLTYAGADQQLWTADGGDKRCLTAYAPSGTPVTGTRILMKACDPNDQTQKFRFTGTGGAYSDNFNVRMVSFPDLCMAVAPPDTALSDWSTIAVSTCNGSAEQKWNAPPNMDPSQVRNIRETS